MPSSEQNLCVDLSKLNIIQLQGTEMEHPGHDQAWKGLLEHPERLPEAQPHRSSRKSSPTPAGQDSHPDTPDRIQLTINFRGAGWSFLFTPNSTLGELTHAVSTYLDIPRDKQTYIITKIGLIKFPFKDLSLALHTFEGKRIQLIGTTYREAFDLLRSQLKQATVEKLLENPFDFLRRVPGLDCQMHSGLGKGVFRMATTYFPKHLEMLLCSGYLAPFLNPDIDDKTREALNEGLRILRATRDLSQLRTYAAKIGITIPVDDLIFGPGEVNPEPGPLPLVWNDYDGPINRTEVGILDVLRPIDFDKPFHTRIPCKVRVDTRIIGPLPSIQCIHLSEEQRSQYILFCGDCASMFHLQWFHFIRKFLCHQVTAVVKGEAPRGLCLGQLVVLQERLARLDYETLVGRMVNMQEMSAIEREVSYMLKRLNLKKGVVPQVATHGVSQDDVVSLKGAIHQLELSRGACVIADEDTDMPDAENDSEDEFGEYDWGPGEGPRQDEEPN